MKKGFTKYLSCIILVVICIALATVFCVHASDAFRGADDKGDDTQSDTQSESTENETPKNVISIGGTVLSEYLYDSSLRCEWISQKNEGEKTVYLAVELYLDTPNTITNARGGRLVVNGEETELFVGTVIGKTNQIATYTATYEAENDLTIDFSAELDIDIKSGEATVPKTITLSGSALVSEEYAKMEEAQKQEAVSSLIELTKISEMETAAETLLGAKGFLNVIVTITDESVDVVVDAEDLTKQQLVQIQDIVRRKTNAAVENIVITPVAVEE